MTSLTSVHRRHWGGDQSVLGGHWRQRLFRFPTGGPQKGKRRRREKRLFRSRRWIKPSRSMIDARNMGDGATMEINLTKQKQRWSSTSTWASPFRLQPFRLLKLDPLSFTHPFGATPLNSIPQLWKNPFPLSPSLLSSVRVGRVSDRFQGRLVPSLVCPLHPRSLPISKRKKEKKTKKKTNHEGNEANSWSGSSRVGQRAPAHAREATNRTENGECGLSAMSISHSFVRRCNIAVRVFTFTNWKERRKRKKTIRTTFGACTKSRRFTMTRQRPREEDFCLIVSASFLLSKKEEPKMNRKRTSAWMEEANKCLRLIPHSLLWGTCFGSAKKKTGGNRRGKRKWRRGSRTRKSLGCFWIRAINKVATCIEQDKNVKKKWERLKKKEGIYPCPWERFVPFGVKRKL